MSLVGTVLLGVQGLLGVAELAAGREAGLDHASGVGLWLVNRVVEVSGGTPGFDVEGGTTASVTLPRMGAETGL